MNTQTPKLALPSLFVSRRRAILGLIALLALATVFAAVVTTLSAVEPDPNPEPDATMADNFQQSSSQNQAGILFEVDGDLDDDGSDIEVPAPLPVPPDGTAFGALPAADHYDDWASVINAAGVGGHENGGRQGAFLSDPHSKVATDPNVFARGGKFFDIDTWNIEAGKVGAQANELVNVAVYKVDKAADGNPWLAIALERTKENGTFALWAEFNRRTDGVNGTAWKMINGSFVPDRTAGDVAVGFELSGNPTGADDLELVIMWDDDLTDAVGITAANNVDPVRRGNKVVGYEPFDPAGGNLGGAPPLFAGDWYYLFKGPGGFLGGLGAGWMNLFPVDPSGVSDGVVWQSINAQGAPRALIPEFQFAEAALNLGAGGLNINPNCEGFGSVHAVSVASLSPNSDAKDVTAPQPLTVSCDTDLSVRSDHVGDTTLVNDSITFTITEQNLGDVPLTSPEVDVYVNLVEDVAQRLDAGDINGAADGDTNDNDILDVGETWVWTLTTPALASINDGDVYTFYAHGIAQVGSVDFDVTHDDALNNPRIGTTGFNDTDDSASITIAVIDPSTMIDVQTARAAGGAFGDAELQFLDTEIVYFRITETNDGDVALTEVDVALVGDAHGPVLLTRQSDNPGNNDAVLDVNEVWVYTGAVAVSGDETFTANGAGLDPLGTVIDATFDPQEEDAIRIDEIHPSTMIDVQSRTAIGPYGEGTLEFLNGDTVYFRVTETNDGDIALIDVDVALVGDVNGPVSLTRQPDNPGNNDAVLDVDETWVYTGSTTVSAEFETFTADGSGLDPIGTTIDVLFDPNERDTIAVDLVTPGTVLTVTPLAPNALQGETIKFTVAEQLDADEVPLADVYVEVWRDGVVVATLGHSLLASPTLPELVISGLGANDDDILEPGEVWTWMWETPPLTKVGDDGAKYLFVGYGTAIVGDHAVIVTDVDAVDDDDSVTTNGVIPASPMDYFNDEDEFANHDLAVMAPDLALVKAVVITELTTTLTNSASVDWDQNLFEPITDAVESTGVVHTTRLAYSFTVTNSGDGAATSVMLTDFLPAGVHIVDNPDGGNVIDNTVTWDLGDIGAGEQKIVTLIVETD